MEGASAAMVRVSADRATPTADLGRRAASGIVLFFVTAVAVWFGFPLFHAVILLAAVIGAFEWRRLCALTETWGGWVVVGTVCLSVPLTYLGGIGPSLLVIAAVGIGGYLLRPGGTGWTGVGAAYLAVPAACAIHLRGVSMEGALILIWLIGIAVATDTGGYVGGKTIGGPRLAPKTSPNKTWSGAIVGATLALAVGLIVAWLIRGEIRPLDGVLALALSIVSQAGDLFESAVKRKHNQKDAGTLIPGHGGVLDRVDGMLFVLPAFTLLSWVGLGLDF